ncbi:Regulator of chromosome condensation [Boothiomyces sp. JEL0838]|nr:Regulator of chromosome condensation [Boothiomyces sp. JEL0838]
MLSPMLRTIDSGISIGPTLRPTLSNCWISHLQIEAELQRAQEIIDELQVALDIVDIDFKLKQDRENLITEEWTRMAAVPQACLVFEEDSEVQVATEEDEDSGYGRLETINEEEEDMVEDDFETNHEAEAISAVANEPEELAATVTIEMPNSDTDKISELFGDYSARNDNPRHRRRRRNVVCDDYYLTGEPLKFEDQESNKDSEDEFSNVASEDLPEPAFNDFLTLKDFVQTVAQTESQKWFPEKSAPLADDVADAEEWDPCAHILNQTDLQNPYLNVETLELLYELYHHTLESGCGKILTEYIRVCETLQNTMKYLDTVHSKDEICPQPPITNQVIEDGPIEHIADSESYSIGQNEDGELGREEETGIDFGRLSINDSLNSSNRLQIRELVCGSLFGYALTTDNQLWSWGLEDCIGRDTGEHPTLLKENVLKVTAGEAISACIDTDGQVWSWGYFRSEKGACKFNYDTEKQLEPTQIPIKDVVDIKAGESHLVCLTKSGNVYTWGFGEHGELGRPISLNRVENGQEFLPTRLLFPPVQKIFAVGHNTFLLNENRVYACGKNSFGELGFGDFNPRNYPEKIEFFNNKKIVQIVGGIHHAVFLDSDGIVYGAGRNSDGQLGFKDSAILSVPKRLPMSVKIRKIAASVSGSSTYVIDSDGYLWTTGQSLYGQLGHWDPNGDPDNQEFTQMGFKKVDLKGDRRVQAVAGGCHFTCITATAPREA